MYGVTTVTTKGQATIPGSIRQLLNIKTGDKLVFGFVDRKKRQLVVNVAEANVVDRLFGSLGPSKRGYVPYSIARSEAGKLLGKKYSVSK